MNDTSEDVSAATITVPDPQADRPLWAAALRITLDGAALDVRRHWDDPTAIASILNRLAATDVGRVVAQTGYTCALRGAHVSDEGPADRLWLRGGTDADELALDQAVLSYLPHPRIAGESLFALCGHLASADAAPAAPAFGFLVGYHSATLLSLHRLRALVATPDSDG